VTGSRTVIYKELDYHALGEVLGIVVRCFYRATNKFASGPARLVSVRPRHPIRGVECVLKLRDERSMGSMGIAWAASRGEIEVELAWVISDLTP
jgi:hypothetical protein